jgi:hypothetical protein
MVDNVLRMIDPGQVLAGQAQPFGALRAGSDQDRLKTGFEQVFQHDIAAAADRHIAKVVDFRNRQDLLKLVAQTLLHLQLIRVDAIFSQAAGLDIAV